MIIEQDVLEALEHMRQIGADTQHWEVKEAVVDLPKSLLDTISAFSNMHGGTIILGVSEKNGFHPAKSFDANKTYTKLQTVGDRLTPVVRMEIVDHRGHFDQGHRPDLREPDDCGCLCAGIA